MNRSELLSVVRRLMQCPAVPFHESSVRNEVETICAENELSCRRDRYGNLLVGSQLGAKRRQLVLVAHMDHPGFEVVQQLGHHKWSAKFLGGVPKEYFKKGTRLRLMPQKIPARLGQSHGATKDRAHAVEAKVKPATNPTFAVWELEDFAYRRGRIYGRACDDLIGVAAILAVLIELKRANARYEAIGVITRAEEVGFGGALAVASSRAISKKSLVVSLETSRELPGVKMGNGVIIRVGDRSSIFDSTATRFLTEMASEIAAADPGFQSQRALMGGGTCEGTVFSEGGFQTAAVCVALGNYHNCGPGNQIAAEFVSVDDVCSMTRLLTHAATQLQDFNQVVGKLPKRLAALDRKHRKRLLKTAN